jgi:hypothetical protein
MKRVILPALVAVLAVPAAAQAAPVKISPHASAVSGAGVASVEVANPNRYSVRGTAKVAVRGRTVLSRKVRLPKRSVTTMKLRFTSGAVAALREAGGRATIGLKLRRANGRKSSARRTLTLSLPSGGSQPPAPPAPGGSGGTGGGDSGGSAPPPASNRWAGRMGTEGPYDDLEITVDNGQMQITRSPFVPVSCLEIGGYNRIALSLELFSATGPFAMGTDSLIAQQGLAVNTLVSGGARTINYKVKNAAVQGDRLTGTLEMSFGDSRYDIFTNTIIFINCAGTQSFEAITAG